MNTEDLLKNKNIEYRSSGADYLIRCLSPEHEDNNPSMRIDKLTGTFHCLSCGYSGNIFRYFNHTRNQADMLVRRLKDKIAKLRTPNLNIPLGADMFSSEFRDISAETYKKFSAFTYSQQLEGMDVSDRIIFPLTDVNGDITCFQARRLYSDLDPKYVNIPKGVEKGFFPACPDIYAGSVVLVEGVFDVLNLYDKGMTNVVSGLGTIRPKKRGSNKSLVDKFSILRLLGVSTIYIMYDGDKAGKSASEMLEHFLKDQFIVDTIELPNDLDPGSMTKHQVKKLKELLYENSSN